MIETKGNEQHHMLTITSSAFTEQGSIPAVFTCDGANGNPPLSFRGIPPRARSLALIVDDPDAPMGTWVHWTLWNISPDTTDVAANTIPRGATEGVTSFGKNGYGGPCPPSGVHRYFFKLYALDTVLDLPETATKHALEEAMKEHIIAQAELVGRYARR